MTRRFRLLAGPNGSGKTTLKRRLERDYAVNFYDFLNADEIFAEVKETGAYAPRLAIEPEALTAYVDASSYDAPVKAFFREGAIAVADDCVRFRTPASVNSYTVALLTAFLSAEHVRQGMSFSQETVFSHPSKVDALAAAQAAGFRTYLYFVATEMPEINVGRVETRVGLGGHGVPPEKVIARHAQSIGQVSAALPHLSRAFFFDNSEQTMRYLASWSPEEGLACVDGVGLPAWFERLRPSFGAEAKLLPRGTAFETSAAAASREAVDEAFAAGLPITVLRDGRVVRVGNGCPGRHGQGCRPAEMQDPGVRDE